MQLLLEDFYYQNVASGKARICGLYSKVAFNNGELVRKSNSILNYDKRDKTKDLLIPKSTSFLIKPRGTYLF